MASGLLALNGVAEIVIGTIAADYDSLAGGSHVRVVVSQFRQNGKYSTVAGYVTNSGFFKFRLFSLVREGERRYVVVYVPCSLGTVRAGLVVAVAVAVPINGEDTFML